MTCLFRIGVERLGIETPAEIDDIGLLYHHMAEFINRVYRIVFKIALISGDLKI